MKKLFTLLVLLVLLVGLAGCSKPKVKNISKDEIFTQEGRYFIYFYRDDCADCKQTNLLIQEYTRQIKTGKFKDKKVVYQVNLSKESNKEIYRIYNSIVLGWGEGQGDGTFFVDNVTDSSKLYIGATSALISVGANGEGDKFAKFIIHGNEGISNYLDNYLKQ